MNGPIRGESIIAAVVSTLVATGLTFVQAHAQRKHERTENERHRRHEREQAQHHRNHELALAHAMQPVQAETEDDAQGEEDAPQG